MNLFSALCNVVQVPLIKNNTETVHDLVAENTNISKDDWDAFETSWDFKRHPLV